MREKKRRVTAFRVRIIKPVGRVVAEGVTRRFLEAERRICNPPSGLTFHYPPYAVGPYAEGGYVASVRWENLKPHLTPERANNFSGARTKGGDDDSQ
jgi:hypothetical protein